MHTLPFFRQNINNKSKMEDPTPRTIFNSHLISALTDQVIPHLEADTEREGEGDDDEEPGDGREEPATHPNTSVRIIS